MTKPLRKFHPTHYMGITRVLSLYIEIVKGNGEYFVYASYYDEVNGSFDKVTKSIVRCNSHGHTYFIKNRQRYYLADFFNKTSF